MIETHTLKTRRYYGNARPEQAQQGKEYANKYYVPMTSLPPANQDLYEELSEVACAPEGTVIHVNT